MARPIEATPVLRGKDAKEFLSRMNAVVMTAERREWLESAARESKEAESKKK